MAVILEESNNHGEFQWERSTPAPNPTARYTCTSSISFSGSSNVVQHVQDPKGGGGQDPVGWSLAYCPPTAATPAGRGPAASVVSAPAFSLVSSPPRPWVVLTPHSLLEFSSVSCPLCELSVSINGDSLTCPLLQRDRGRKGGS